MCYGQPAATVWDHHPGLLQHLHLKPHRAHISAVRINLKTPATAPISIFHYEHQHIIERAFSKFGTLIWTARRRHIHSLDFALASFVAATCRVSHIRSAVVNISPTSWQYEKCYWVIDRAGSRAAGDHLDLAAHLDEWRNLEPRALWSGVKRYYYACSETVTAWGTCTAAANVEFPQLAP